MIVTGDLPSLEHVPEVNVVPGLKAQEYVATCIKDLFPPDLQAKTFLIDDSTGTSDDLVTKSGELIFQGTAIEKTSFFKVLLHCLDNACQVRIWWASDDPAAHRNVVIFRDRQSFQERILSDLSSGNDLNVVYEPKDRVAG